MPPTQDPAQLPFSVDAMRLDDIPAIMAIERRVFSLAWSSGIYRRELTANPWSHYLVLRSRAAHLPPVLAYGGVWQMDLAAHIPTIATHPDYQGRKLGGYLLAHLLVLAEGLGCTEATLEVRFSNKQAQVLYRQFQFEEVGVRRRYYTNNHEDALIMTRPSLALAELQAELAAATERLLAAWGVASPA